MSIKTWRERCETHPDHDGIVSDGMIRARMQEEIDELRQALEQAEQAPPVAWSDPSEPDSRYAFSWSWSGAGRHHSHIQPLYTAPPQRQPLTNEEISKVAAPFYGVQGFRVEAFARAIEAKLKAKNT
jgi:hypothetical protein